LYKQQTPRRTTVNPSRVCRFAQGESEFGRREIAPTLYLVEGVGCDIGTRRVILIEHELVVYKTKQVPRVDRYTSLIDPPHARNDRERFGAIRAGVDQSIGQSHVGVTPIRTCYPEHVLEQAHLQVVATDVDVVSFLSCCDDEESLRTETKELVGPRVGLLCPVADGVAHADLVTTEVVQVDRGVKIEVWRRLRLRWGTTTTADYDNKSKNVHHISFMVGKSIQRDFVAGCAAGFFGNKKR